MRDTEFLGAGDPGALEAFLGIGDRSVAVAALTEAFLRFGWLAAKTDPLGLSGSADVPELAPERYGFGPEEAEHLRRAYCGSTGWQIGHIECSERRAWLAASAEETIAPQSSRRQRALDLIASAELLETVFDRRLPGAKTFGLSGCETMVVLLDRLLGAAAGQEIEAVNVAGVHRGRSTLMALVFGKPIARLVADAKGVPEVPEDWGASSDSPYHLGWTGAVSLPSGSLDVSVAPHPSHLSVVAPVVQGRTRAGQDRGHAVLPIAIHTDAAFAGQGINAEMLQLSGLPPYDIGGTIHVILNNQIGFTTDMAEARTARTPGDVARMIGAPIVHVNGDDPDAVLRIADVAMGYRRTFGTDIVIDLIGYRRKGHNEIDNPHFTQPEMYARISAMRPLSERFANVASLVPGTRDLEQDLDDAFSANAERPNLVSGSAQGLRTDIEDVMLRPGDTGLEPDAVNRLCTKLTQCPHAIDLHSKSADFLEKRRRSVTEDTGLDWATAEALAIASLLDGGTAVRLSGQDSVRGAFSQRHLRLHCQSTGITHDVLDGFAGKASIYNTPLIENAVLAFEYGYSLGALDALTIWEAQFGDFLNTAQSIFDQFIICGEDRWLAQSNLVLALPHGVDGGGPDHATAHPERLLSACANGNIQVINPSVPANWFHALRRQVLADWRKPLVLLAPKALLRHPLAKSKLSEFSGRFRSVVDEDRPARRLVMSTGKLSVLLQQERDRKDVDVALVRLEQLYPLDSQAIADVAARFPDADLVWAQEEPENFGYFQWLDRRLEKATGRRWRCVSRPASPSASAGPKAWDDALLQSVIGTALGLED